MTFITFSGFFFLNKSSLKRGVIDRENRQLQDLQAGCTVKILFSLVTIIQGNCGGNSGFEKVRLDSHLARVFASVPGLSQKFGECCVKWCPIPSKIHQVPCIGYSVTFCHHRSH